MKESLTLGVTEAAREFGCSTKTIRNMIRLGQLHAIRCGSKWFISRASFDALFARTEERSA